MKSVTLAAVLAVVGCNSEAPPKARPAPTDGLVLLSPGIAPRTQLRYRLTAGTKTPLEQAVELDVSLGELRRAMPAIVLATTIHVDEVLEDGTARVRTVVTAGFGRDRAGAAGTDLVTAHAGQLVGLASSGMLSPDGRISGSKIELAGRDVPPQLAEELTNLRQSLEQLAMPLPDQEVGLGAMWTFRKTLEVSGMTVVATTTVIVNSIDDGRVSFATISELAGEDQTVTQNDMSLEVKNIAGMMSGKGTFDLSRMSMTGDRVFELAAEMVRDGNATPVKMTAMTHVSPVVPASDADAGDAGVAAGDAGTDALDGGTGAGSAIDAGSGSAEPATPVVKKKKRRRRIKKPDPETVPDPASGSAETGSADTGSAQGAQSPP